MSLVEIRSLSVKRGDVAVLTDVDLTLSAGELLVVLGPNGAGKSTLARILLGLEAPTAGTLSRARVRTAYVPQSLRRDPTLPLSTRAFLHLGQARGEKTRSELIEALGLSELMDRPIAALSGGELRRAALARALTRNPELLVLDEPLAGVDAASQEPIYELIADVAHRAGACVVLIAHEVLTGVRLADRILCLDKRPLAIGPPHEIVRSAAFENIFGALIAEAAQHKISHQDPPRKAANG